MRQIEKLRFNILWSILVFSSTLGYAQQSYLNPKLPVETRVKLLMKQMTLEEKITQMNLDYDVPETNWLDEITSDQISDIKIKESDKATLKANWIKDVKEGKMGTTRNITDYVMANEYQAFAEKSRLKIPLFIVQNHVHGVGENNYTTFPTFISMASSFNPALVRRAAAVIARESRLTGTNWTFTPTVDVSRDSRWGRTGETWGEDPLLTSKMGVAMVKGLQFDNELKYRIVACLKHYVAGGQSQNGLNFSPVDISDRTLYDIHIAPFKAAIEAGAASIMAGHNDVQGEPVHGSHRLLWDILRDELGFKGFVITDWLDMERLITLHKVAADLDEAVGMAVNAGIDVHNHGKNFRETVLKLVKQGVISEARIDDAVSKILRTKFEYGLFENRYVSEKDRETLICTKEDKQLALELARQSIVLLKNKENVLPIKGGKKVLLTGTNVDNYAILGDWMFDTKFDNIIKIKDGFFQEKPADIQLDCFSYPHKKYNVSDENIEESVKRAKEADVIVLVIGGSHFRTDNSIKTGGENSDVQDLELFGNQLELLKRLKATGKTVVTVLVGGRNLALEETEKYSDAIIQAWEPGMMGGKVLAEIVYGKISPSGKLPMSVPRTTGQVNVWYSYSPSLYFRKFVFGKMGPLYEFGDGLSYTKFEYSDIKFLPQIKSGLPQKVSITVKNVGNMAADEVVLCYINDKISSIVTPVKKLVAFDRVGLAPSESKTVTFEIEPDAMALYNAKMKLVIEPGDFDVMIADKKITFKVSN